MRPTPCLFVTTSSLEDMLAGAEDMGITLQRSSGETSTSGRQQDVSSNSSDRWSSRASRRHVPHSRTATIADSDAALWQWELHSIPATTQQPARDAAAGVAAVLASLTFGSSGGWASSTLGGGGGRADGVTRIHDGNRFRWLPWMRQPVRQRGCHGSCTSETQHLGCAGGGGCGGGGVLRSSGDGRGASGILGGPSAGSGRMMLLASLTTSVVAAASGARAARGDIGAPTASSAAATAAAVGSGNGGSSSSGWAGGPAAAAGLWRGFNLPQLSIMRLPGSPSFAEEQDTLQQLLDYHVAKNGGFPRPCPRCKSTEFMVPRTADGASTPPPTTSTAVTSGIALTPISSSGPTTTSTSSASPAAAAAAAAPAASEVVVEWRSRPLRCDTCGVWVHLGCEGVETVEQVPPQPWFHCKACRDTFLRLEAAAHRNPHPSGASPAHSLYLLTPADINAYRAQATLAAALSGSPGAPQRSLSASLDWQDPTTRASDPNPGLARGPVGAVVPLLSEGFNADAIQGFGDLAREYDGGKYGAVLVYRGQPVSAATFNVFGSEAQLCLLATAVQHRLRGHGSALVEDLETALASLGVSRLFVQPRGAALPLWVARLGYSLVHPTQLPGLHARLPLAYYDCPLLEKTLLHPTRPTPPPS